MNIFRQLTEKPWLPDPDGIVDSRGGSISAAIPARIGLMMFLIVVGVLFTMLTIAYAGRMAFEEVRLVPQPRLMWQNTILLILASAALQLSQIAAQRDQWDRVKIALLAGGVLTIAFLIGQIFAWQQLATLGFFEFTNPGIALFILITGLHGLHLLGGLVAWGRTTDKVWRRDAIGAGKVRQSIELCTLYWHFLLAVWLVLFGMLFSGNNILGIALSIAGVGAH